MSPASQAKHKKLTQYERTNGFRKLVRYEENEVTLDDEQNDERTTDLDPKEGNFLVIRHPTVS